MHLDEEHVQRFLHHELQPAVEASARGHLVECADCRRRVEEAEREEREVHVLLRAVDDAAPEMDAEAVAALAQRPQSPRHRSVDPARARTQGGHRGRRLRWAAGILVALAVAGAAYAVPGSPLPAWVDAVVGWIGGHPHPAPPAPLPAQDPDGGVAGIAVAPGPELLILFTSRQNEGRADVSLTDEAEVVIRAPIGAATFTTDEERLVIHNPGSSATFEIRIPNTAPRVEIRVGEERVFLKNGARVTVGTSVDGRVRYLIPLTSARP